LVADFLFYKLFIFKNIQHCEIQITPLTFLFRKEKLQKKLSAGQNLQTNSIVRSLKVQCCFRGGINELS